MTASTTLLSGEQPDHAARMRELRLAELLGALSHALDMVEGQPAGHWVRCCWIGIHIGREEARKRAASTAGGPPRTPNGGKPSGTAGFDECEI